MENPLEGKNFERTTSKLPSNAEAAPSSTRVASVVVPDEERGRMPLTKDKYMVRENPHLVAWEREVRKFLRKLSPEHRNRVAATMIYEWATNRDLAKMNAAGESANGDLRHINKILRWYFGEPYMTWIAGRKVPRCYSVRVGYYIRSHRPMTLTLWAEYAEGTLYP